MNDIEARLEEISRLKREFYHFDEWGIEKPTNPNIGATVDELSLLRFGLIVPLPLEHALLLEKANGWVNICLSASLLSTYQINREFGHFARSRFSEILQLPIEKILPISVTDPVAQTFSCVSWIFGSAAAQLVEVNEFGEQIEYLDLVAMLGRFEKSLSGRIDAATGQL